MTQRFQCKCGEEFTEYWQLLDHIALYNSRWPYVGPTDRHGKLLKPKLETSSSQTSHA